MRVLIIEKESKRRWGMSKKSKVRWLGWSYIFSVCLNISLMSFVVFVSLERVVSIFVSGMIIVIGLSMVYFERVWKGEGWQP